MALAFSSTHNKYVATPDWFAHIDLTSQTEQTTTVANTQYIGGTVIGSGSSVATGKSNITLYNKYALKLVKLDSDALSVKGVALVLKTTSTSYIGDIVYITGWDSTDYISVAGNTLTVTSTIDKENENYGILFYDNRQIPISGQILSSSPEEIPVPENASFFRISVPTNQQDFLIEHYITTQYTKEQLELSNENTKDYLELNETIPEGLSVIAFNDDLKLLVQQPLSLSRDTNNVIKLFAKTADVEDMFVWDKKLAAFGYDKETGKAYSYVDGEQQFITNENGETVPEMTDNRELWMYDETLTDKWIIKTTKQRFSLLEGLMEYDAEKDSFLFHKNIITSGGIVMYADLDDVNVPGLYDGLPIDNNTIFWNYDEEGNKVSLSAKTIDEVELTGDGNAVTDVKLSEDNKKLTFVKGEEFIRSNDIDNDTIYWDTVDDLKTLKSKRGVERIEIEGDGNALTSVEQSEDKESLFFKKEETFVTVDDIMEHVKTDDDTITVNSNGELEVLKGGVEIVSSLPDYYEPDILYILV